jgi:hypothetical protein
VRLLKTLAASEVMVLNAPAAFEVTLSKISRSRTAALATKDVERTKRIEDAANFITNVS